MSLRDIILRHLQSDELPMEQRNYPAYSPENNAQLAAMSANRAANYATPPSFTDPHVGNEGVGEMRPIPQIQHTPAASPYNTHYPAFSQVAADEIRKSQWAADVREDKQNELWHEKFMRDWEEAAKNHYLPTPGHHHARHRK